MIGLYVFAVLFAVIALPLIFSRLEDEPHPDEPAYRRHQSLRVVRAAPEREEVGA